MKTSTLLSAFAFTVLTSVQAFSQVLTAQVATQNPSCFGTQNGQVTIDIIGGTSPYLVNGFPVYGNQFITANLGAGNFGFMITDNANASTSVDVTLVAPQPLNLQATVSNVSNTSSANGAIDLTVPASNVTYEWVTLNGSGLVQGAEDQSGLSAGIYNVTITEANGCQTTKRFDITQPVLLTSTTYMNFGLTPVTQGISTGSTTSSAISVYPNPSLGHISLKATASTKNATILNEMGVVVRECSLNNEGAIEEIDLVPGAYTLIVVDNEGQKSTERIIIH